MYTKVRMNLKFGVVILFMTIRMLHSSCTIETKSELSVHLDDWIEDPSASRHVCGDIRRWNVSRVTDMSYLFCALQESWTPFECDSNRLSFNADISGWDVSKVTSLEGTFHGASSFDLSSISLWDVSRVRTFEKQTFTFLNPLENVCTKKNVYVTAKPGVRLRPPENKILCIRRLECVDAVQDELASSSTLCEFNLR